MTTDATWIVTTPQRQWVRQSPEEGVGQANLTVTDQRHQRWEGFGGCFNELGWQALSGLDERGRSAAMDALFDPQGDCRLSLCRLPIGASDYAIQWHSLNETPGDLRMEHFSIERDRGCLIPYIRQALERRPDMTLFASPWSPPTWMKFPAVYNYGTLVWKPEILAAYALYFVRFVQTYAAEGITIHQVHPQNEPVADQKFPSCLWTGEQLREFICEYLGPAFEEHGLDTELWLGTLNTDDYDGFVHTVLGSEEARSMVVGVGFQWAGKGAVQRTHESWPDVRLMQTENECGDGKNSWAYAWYVQGLIRHYIANGVNAYVYWNMVLPPGGLSSWGWRQNSMVTADPGTRTVIYNPEFYVMKHYAHFIEPGAVRRGLAGRWTANATAFENPDGRLVVVVHNPFARPERLTLQAGGKTLTLDMPAESLSTVVV